MEQTIKEIMLLPTKRQQNSSHSVLPIAKSETACYKVAETYPDPEELFLKINNDSSIIRNEEMIFSETVPCLYDLDKVYGEGTAEAFILSQLQMVNNATNVKEKLTKKQLDQTCVDICSEKRFMQLNLYEWRLFIHRLKMGYYGDLYGRLDAFSICSALNQKFLRERSAAIDRIYNEQRKKQDDENRSVTEGMAKVVQDAIAAGYEKVTDYIREHPDEVRRRIGTSITLPDSDGADGGEPHQG